jgi:ketosteroid isomerase-like protein
VSEANVEIVQSALAAQRRHDNGAALALYDPEIVIEPVADGPDPTVLRGIPAMHAFWREVFGTFDSLDVDVEEWIDAGDDVIAIMRISGQGRQSGAPFVSREAHVWTVRGGKMRRLRVYATRAEALEAVGSGA